MSSSQAPRAVDHLVLPVSGLAVARARLEKLGFTVAPDGIHPFGTANCCVFLADGTYLEPLAAVDERAEAEAARRGNVFAARDIAYRYRRGDNGFSAIVFATGDAAADHAGFAEDGFSAGPVLDFSRPFADAAGRVDTATFRLAFAADPRAPDCLFFTCQSIGFPKVDRAALERHENGALALASVVLSAPEVFSFRPIVRAASGAAAGSLDDGGCVLAAANARIEMLGDQELRSRFGVPSTGDRGLQARAAVFRVADLAATKSRLLSRGVDCERFRGRVIVPPPPGQGAVFAFEAS